MFVGPQMDWSSTVDDYYPVSPRPRWGHGSPTHPAIGEAIERFRSIYENSLREIAQYRDAIYAVPYYHKEGILGPCWDNVWFSCLDACSLMGFLLSKEPKTYLEIGSGYSTLFARHAINYGRLHTKITSVDPHPRVGIDVIYDTVIRSPLENCSLEIFEALHPGDFLFFDGSHRVFTNSDTTALFFDVLPRLKRGVVVHLHDIFLPADYPPHWNGRLYSEQYLLGAMLLCGAPPFRILLPNFFACQDKFLAREVKGILEGRPGEKIPFIYGNSTDVTGVSFWMETR